MFEDLRRAWREAVENFWTELRGDTSAERGRLLEARVGSARAELRRLSAELERTRARGREERQEAEVCRRREALAREIDDADTVEIARRFGARHAERAALLERKAAVLESEHDLLAREIAEMVAALEDIMPEEARAAGEESSRAEPQDEEAASAEFERLDRDRREREAGERLEELKRRMS